jgi:hypothetical protein
MSTLLETDANDCKSSRHHRLTWLPNHEEARDKIFWSLDNDCPTLLNFRDCTPKRTDHGAIGLIEIYCNY